MSYSSKYPERRRAREKCDRRVRRKRIDFFRRLGFLLVSTIVAVVSGYLTYIHIPLVKVNKALAAGDAHIENADYEEAINSYSKAIAIDPDTASAYSDLARAYLAIDDKESAMSTLHTGWETTGNKTLLSNYHAVILNEAVAEMNSGNTDLGTVSKIVDVLEEDNTNKDALQLVNASYSRLEEDSYFEEYAELVGRIIDANQGSEGEDLKNAIDKFIVPSDSCFTVKVSDIDAYIELIDRAENAVGVFDKAEGVKACLVNAKEVLGMFSGIFEQLDIGNVDELRDFVVSDEYIKLRDIFLNKEETPQENTVYIPISREKIILNCRDGKWSYRFLDFDENPTTAGVITIWANFFEDDGVQRSSVSYEPASIAGNRYPHTKYLVTYLYSYITKGNSTKVAQLNYRLEIEIQLPDGTTKESVIGDWGGSNEWEMDIDTIESRIKA